MPRPKLFKKRSRIDFMVDTELKVFFQHYAREHRTTMSELFTQWLSKLQKERGQEKSP